MSCEFLLELRRINVEEPLSECLIFLPAMKQGYFCNMGIHIINLKKHKDEDSCSSRNYWELIVS